MPPQSSQFVRDIFEDWLFSFPQGMNSGVDPLLLPKEQLAFASNSTVRSTFVHPRPPWNDLTLDFGGDAALQAAVEDGLFQGACWYQPDTGPETVMASISGRLFQFIPNGLNAQVFERTGGNPQDPTVVQAWLWQAEFYVIWNDGVNLSVFWDGNANTTARSTGNTNPILATTAGAAQSVPAIGGSAVFNLTAPFASPVGGTYALESFGLFQVTLLGPGPNDITYTNLSISPAFYAPPMHIFGINFKPQFPVCKMGVYGLGRIWMALANGRDFIAGDIVKGPSGTLANQFRDAILFITENTFLFGGGTFTVPGDAGTIRAMRFASTLDASLGQGPLQVYTALKVFSCQAPVVRAQWTSVTNPILTESLIDSGGLGQNSTIAVNGDTMFRSVKGVQSLVLARRDFATWGNVPISREMQRVLLTELQSLLPIGSAVTFDNRMLMTVRSSLVEGHGVVSDGVIAINFDPISTIQGKAPSVWDGVWPGLNVLQLVTGEFELTERCYFFALDSGNKIKLRELMPSTSTQFADNSNTRIYWFFETHAMFGKTVDPKRALKCLEDGEIYVDELEGEVLFETFYKPDQWPCWIPWHSWTECQKLTGANDQPQFRPRMGLGTPSKTPCDKSTNRPFVHAYTYQIRVQVTGKCRVTGGHFLTSVVPQATFAPRACNAEPCKELACVVPSDFFIPAPPPPPPIIFVRVKVCNDEQTAVCPGGEIGSPVTIEAGIYCRTLIFASTTPQSERDIEIEQTKTELNAIALAAATAQLECTPVEGIYAILGYVDGTFAGDGNLDGNPAWDGVFHFTFAIGPNTVYMGSPATNQLSIDGGKTICNAYLYLNGGTWILDIWGQLGLLWRGVDGVNPADATGVYTKNADGTDPGPATVTVIIVPGAYGAGANADCFPI